MARKRMFDKGLLETDAFMDMPMPTKALYFLLGMEADDEGFVSPKRVMRLYGGNDDDLKVLIAKNFVIQFESGVIVITDWHENNYLDKNKVQETKYQAEKELLSLSSNKYHRLNKSLPEVNKKLTQYRIEENRIEENRGIQLSSESVPLKKTTVKNKIKKSFLDERRMEAGKPPMEKRKLTEKQSLVLKRMKSLDYFHAKGIENGFEYLAEDDEQANKKYIGLSRNFEKRYGERCEEVIDWWFESDNAWCDYHPSNFFNIGTYMKFDNKANKANKIKSISL